MPGARHTVDPVPMKLPKKPVSDHELSGEIAFKYQRNGRVTPNSEDWVALLQSLQERWRILKRRAVLASQFEQLRARASAQLRATADQRNRK